jgi:hypothetical protein
MADSRAYVVSNFINAGFSFQVSMDSCAFNGVKARKVRTRLNKRFMRFIF